MGFYEYTIDDCTRHAYPYWPEGRHTVQVKRYPANDKQQIQAPKELCESIAGFRPLQADHIHQFLVRSALIEARTTLQEVIIPVPLQLRHISMGPLCEFDGLDEKYCGLELFAPENGNPTST